jgi:TPR repeat protein
MMVFLTVVCVLLNTSVIVSYAAPSPRGLQSAPSAQELCDQLANSPIDEAKVGKGVDVRKLQVAEALPACKEAASRSPSPHFIFLYGRVLEASQIPGEAFKQFKRAADKGYGAAMYYVGISYDKGAGVTQSYSEAAAWYRKAADAGSAIAMNNLGFLYQNGKGVPKSNEDAFSWYRKAAEAGSGAGMFSLGLMYQYGLGTPVSDSDAVTWFRKGAEAGNKDAMNNLGLMYSRGRGVPKSDVDAAQWYRTAAEAGNVIAMCNLGNRYAAGLGVPPERCGGRRLVPQICRRWLRCRNDESRLCI